MVFVILPQILLLILAGLVLVFDAVWKDEWKRWLGWLTAGGLAIILVVSLVFSRPGDEPQLVFGGMLNHDWFGFAFTLIILFGAAISCLFIMDMGEAGRRGEFYMLLLISVIGMTLMASAADMVML
jgi:NADH-quinone oxidoreductase subunit N